MELSCEEEMRYLIAETYGISLEDVDLVLTISTHYASFASHWARWRDTGRIEYIIRQINDISDIESDYRIALEGTNNISDACMLHGLIGTQEHHFRIGTTCIRVDVFGIMNCINPRHNRDFYSCVGLVFFETISGCGSPCRAG